MIEVPRYPAFITPRVICGLLSHASALGAWRAATAAGAPASATGPTANTAVFVPFVVVTTATFKRGFWVNGSVATNAGNVVVGIYDEAQNRLATTGLVAASGNSVMQSAAFTADVTLTPGRYYMSIVYSASGANSVFGVTPALNWKAAGLYIQAAASPLPNPATFATWATQTLTVFGISQDTFV